MYNYTLIKPYTLQVTHDKEILQKKDIRFCNSRGKNDDLLDLEPFFLEKYINGYSNILSAISNSDKVYFTLPRYFNEKTILRFVSDLLIACSYANLEFIVFDRTRCAESELTSTGKILVYHQIEEMFEQSNCSVIYIESDTCNKTKQKSSLTNPYFRFCDLDTTEINFVELNQLFKKVHSLLDFKESISGYQANNFNRQSGGNVSKYSYTLN